MIKSTDLEYIVRNCNQRINRCDAIIYEKESKSDVEEKKLFLAMKSCYQEIADQIEYVLRKERRERWQKGHPQPMDEETVGEPSS